MKCIYLSRKNSITILKKKESVYSPSLSSRALPSVYICFLKLMETKVTTEPKFSTFFFFLTFFLPVG